MLPMNPLIAAHSMHLTALRYIIDFKFLNELSNMPLWILQKVELGVRSNL
jgi:hypothetical protein